MFTPARRHFSPPVLDTVVAAAEAGYLSADLSAPQGLAFLKMLEASAGVVQIAATIEGYASLPLALGGLGAGILM